MNRPADLFELLAWAVRLVAVALVVGLLAVLVFGCTTNAITFATNPRCMFSCKAEPANPSASSVRIKQTIEVAPHANP